MDRGRFIVLRLTLKYIYKYDSPTYGYKSQNIGLKLSNKIWKNDVFIKMSMNSATSQTQYINT